MVGPPVKKDAQSASTLNHAHDLAQSGALYCTISAECSMGKRGELTTLVVQSLWKEWRVEANRLGIPRQTKQRQLLEIVVVSVCAFSIFVRYKTRTSIHCLCGSSGTPADGDCDWPQLRYE